MFSVGVLSDAHPGFDGRQSELRRSTARALTVDGASFDGRLQELWRLAC